MKLILRSALLAIVALNVFAAQTVAAEGVSFADELVSIQREFDAASFSGLGKSERKKAFQALVEHAASFSERYPENVEAVAWNGIVLSSYAGEVSAMGAMKYAKAARTALHEAEAMAPNALDGGIYASLGALYSKVPGGFVGFGNDELAADYFQKALNVDPNNIDSNYFFGEFLIGQEQYQRAVTVLQTALTAPVVAARPLFDSGRRATIRELLEQAQRETS
jgi:tetratricopeptide (TPR) repeat protein